MANLVVSRVCNLDCAYCFARPSLDGARRDSGMAFISLPAFAQCLDFVERSGIDQVRLIGGEPTLHPQFAELVQLAYQRGRFLLVFSHGLVDEAALESLEALPEERCRVLVNMNAAHNGSGLSKREANRRNAVLRQLGKRAMLGYNIYMPRFDLEPLLPVIAESGCQPAIRLGLAHPANGSQNAHLHPKQYPCVGQQIARSARRLAAAGVRLEFDCGFVRCMFSPADLELLQQCAADAAWRCSPILDLDLDGRALHCFPLGESFQARIQPTSLAAGLRAEIAEQVKPYRTAGIYAECSTCAYKLQDECTGGCLAHVVGRFYRADFTIHQNIKTVSP